MHSRMRTTLLGLLQPVVVVIALSACGGSGNSDAGSIAIGTGEWVTATRHEVSTSAMEPTLHCARPGPGCLGGASDRVLVESPARDLKRGDLVLFLTPPRAEQHCPPAGTFVKRLVGLPGERWEAREGRIFIDGRELREPYVAPERRDFNSYPPRRLGASEYLVMGDNRVASCDSRLWGGVPATHITGRVVEIERAG